ncbi:MAG: GNVR domain-containing protein, partial [Deltaproteobacteria bacterium]
KITSRTSLEELSKRFHLYPETAKGEMVEDGVATMRKAIRIQPEGRADVFKISYEGKNPQQVMQVTNALAAKFIEENLRFRAEWTTDNLAYVQNELKMAKKTLDKKEAAMRDYKLKYYNEMPQQRDTNMARLNALQNQYQNLQNSIQDLERTRVLVQEQITLRQKLQTSSGGENLLSTDNSFLGLADAKRKLILLQGRYTDRHPDIIRLKALIKELERSAAGSSASTGRDLSNGEFGLQIQKIDMNIKDLQLEMARIQKQMKRYQDWIDAAPVREAEWASLTRDHDEFRKYYENLVSRSLQAESAETLEKQQKGSQFRIVDPASFPDKPFRPNFLRFMLVAVALGLGLGGGVPFLLESFDTSFKDASDLEKYLGLPIACSIPLIHTEKEKRQLKIKNNLWAAAFAAAVVIITSGIITLWYTQLIII